MKQNFGKFSFRLHGVMEIVVSVIMILVPFRTLLSQETELKIQTMLVDIWPEYDDPRVLVIYQGELVSDIPLPQEFSFLIPRSAQVHMAGGISKTGGHIHAQFTVEPFGIDLTEIKYQLTEPRFYMEFYYNPFIGGKNKIFIYPLVSSFSIEELTVNVQQPLKSTNFRTEPPAVVVLEGEDGFKYNHFVFGKLEAEQRKDITVSYTKKGNKPSIKIKESSSSTSGSFMKNTLIIITVLLVGILGYAIFTNKKKSTQKLPQKEIKRIKTTKATDSPKFCTQCGSALKPNARFCSNCGKKVQR